MTFLKKHVVTVEFIEKSDGKYYPVSSIYEANPQRCSELQKLGYLGEEVKEQKGSNNGSSGSKQLAAEAGEKNESRKNEQEDNPPAGAES